MSTVCRRPPQLEAGPCEKAIGPTVRPGASGRLYCNRCGGDHQTLWCSRDVPRSTDTDHPVEEHPVGRLRLLQQTVTPPRRFACSCRHGDIALDGTTRREIGYARLFFEPFEERYYLDGKPLSRDDLEHVDWSTPKYVVDPRYIGSDGKLLGVILAVEYCSECEVAKRSRVGVEFRLRVPSLSGKRSYPLVFGPLAPAADVHAFFELEERAAHQGRRSQREWLACCLVGMAEYARPRLSQRQIARNLKIPRGRIQSIVARFRQRRAKTALPQ